MAYLLEDFTQADGTLSVGGYTSFGSQSAEVRSNKLSTVAAASAGAGQGIYKLHGLTIAGNADWRIDIRVDTALDTTRGGVNIWLINSGTFNGYGLFVGNAVHVQKVTGGTSSNLTNTGRPGEGGGGHLASWVTLVHEASGDMEAFLDGVSWGTVTDTTFTGSFDMVLIANYCAESPTFESTVDDYLVTEGLTPGVAYPPATTVTLTPQTLTLTAVALSTPVAPTTFKVIGGETLILGDLVLYQGGVGVQVSPVEGQAFSPLTPATAPSTVNLTAQTLTASPVALAVQPGAATVTVTPTALTVTPVALALAPGAVTTTLAPQTLTVAPVTVTPTSDTGVALTPIDLTVAPVALAPAGGAVTVTLTALVLTATPTSLVPTPGAVTVTAVTLELTVTPVSLSPSAVIQIALTPVDLTAAPVALAPTPGAATVTLTPVDLTVATVALAPSTTTLVNLAPVTATVAPVDLVVAPGAATVALTSLTVTVTPVAVTPSTATQVDLAALELTVTTVALAPTPGAATVTVTPVDATVTPVLLAIEPGPVTLTVTPAELVVQAIALAVFSGHLPRMLAILGPRLEVAVGDLRIERPAGPPARAASAGAVRRTTSTAAPLLATTSSGAHAEGAP